MRSRLVALAVDLGLAIVLLPAGQAATSGASSRGPALVVSTDFDGDGFADTAIGVAFEDVNGHNAAGAVNVLYGSAPGLSSDGNQFWTQDSPGVLDEAENGDEFGRRLAAGDFDGDGYADLAIGVPIESVGATNGAGAVNVLYGGPAGLTADRNQLWTQDSPGLQDGAEPMDNFGFGVSSGDFDGDGHFDLAIGDEKEDVGDVVDAGAVNVLYGSPAGLASPRNRFLSQDTPGVPDRAEEGDLFGSRVKTGDFNGDAFDDLVLEGQKEDVGAAVDAGGLAVLYGSAAGLSAAGAQFWTQDSPGIREQAEDTDLFAEFATSGDFDGDGYADLAVGAPGDSVGVVAAAGVLNVLYGSATGLSAQGNQVWSQNSPGVIDVAESGDAFGRSVAGGDFNGDAFSDLAAGDQFEDVGAVVDAGAVNVLYGSAAGLTATGNQFWTQDGLGLGEGSEEGDQWGRYVAWADFDADGFPDLIVGGPFEDVGPIIDAGGANVLYGSSAGLTTAAGQFWSQDSPGIDDEAEPGDQFGRYFPSAS